MTDHPTDGPAGEDKLPDPTAAREEAERLVATGLAALSMAADRIGAPARRRGGAAAAGYDVLGDMLFGPANDRRHRVANDSPECCQCPVCRLISAARAPSPGFAERLATGVGNLAEGAVRVLRTVAGPAQPPSEAEPPGWEAAGRAADPSPAAPEPASRDRAADASVVEDRSVQWSAVTDPVGEWLREPARTGPATAAEPAGDRPAGDRPAGDRSRP